MNEDTGCPYGHPVLISGKTKGSIAPTLSQFSSMYFLMVLTAGIEQTASASIIAKVIFLLPPSCIIGQRFCGVKYFFYDFVQRNMSLYLFLV